MDIYAESYYNLGLVYFIIEDKESAVELHKKLKNMDKVLADRLLKYNDFRILQNNTAKEFNALKTKLINDVQKEVIDIAITKGKMEGYVLIIEKNSGSVLYAKNSLDLTEEIIQDYDKKTTPKK